MERSKHRRDRASSVWSLMGGEMREKEESRMNPGISGLVDSVGGGATLQQGHRSSSKYYRKIAMVLSRACARDLTSQNESVHSDVHQSLDITYLALTSFMLYVHLC